MDCGGGRQRSTSWGVGGKGGEALKKVICGFVCLCFVIIGNWKLKNANDFLLLHRKEIAEIEKH